MHGASLRDRAGSGGDGGLRWSRDEGLPRIEILPAPRLMVGSRYPRRHDGLLGRLGSLCPVKTWAGSPAALVILSTPGFLEPCAKWRHSQPGASSNTPLASTVTFNSGHAQGMSSRAERRSTP